MKKGRPYKSWVVFVVAVSALPVFIRQSYDLHIIVGAGIHGLIAIGLALLMGYAGQISLGQGAFYAIGSYSSAILAVNGPHLWPALGDGWSWIGMLLGMLICAFVALTVGFPALRLRSHYLAMATLGIAVIVYQTALAADWLTGGEPGIGSIPKLSILGHKIDSPIEFYYLVWGTVAVAMLLSINLINSRVGRALRSVHGDETASRSLGVNTAWYKVQIFMVSAVLAAIAGSFNSHHLSFVGSSSFGIHLSVMLVVMVVVGGMSNVWAALGGAVFLYVLEEVLRQYQEWMPLIYGLILLLIMMFIPQGLFVGIGQAIGKLTSIGRRSKEGKTG